MINSERRFYDILTWIYIILIIGASLIFVPLYFLQEDPALLINVVNKIISFIVFIPFIILIYVVSIIILAIRRVEKLSEKIVIIVVSILVIPPISAIVFYFTTLRKKIPVHR